MDWAIVAVETVPLLVSITQLANSLLVSRTTRAALREVLSSTGAVHVRHRSSALQVRLRASPRTTARDRRRTTGVRRSRRRR